MKKTKIICTIGPSSQDRKTLTKMVQNGMNIARLNFSHGTYQNHTLLMKNIRAVSRKLRIPVAIMQDLQGPKIRVSELVKPINAKKGQALIIGEHFTLDFDISHSVKPKENILIEDGLIELLVKKVVPSKLGHSETGRIYCQVVAPGIIQSHKGVNLPQSKVAFAILTDKDIQDLKFGLQSDVDYVALSFVRNSKDIVKIKDLIKKYNPKKFEAPRVIAKIERNEALKNFKGIIHEADAIMVARGDLGVEIADTQVPVIQKNIIAQCVAAAKPVIVATQMLDSMIRNPRPTRAEVSDVANAVIDRADAVMLSGETAFGQFPVEAVSEMNRIIEATESSPYVHQSCRYIGPDKHTARASLIAVAVGKLALSVDAKVIIGATETGFTARLISHQRPDHPILILTDHPKVYRQMTLFWGVIPLFVKSLTALKNIDGLIDYCLAETKKLKLIKKGHQVVMVAGNPFGKRMNVVKAVTVK